jgi:hypothetical protein
MGTVMRQQTSGTNVRFCTINMHKARKLHIKTDLLFNANYLYNINSVVQSMIFTPKMRPLCDLQLVSY